MSDVSEEFFAAFTTGTAGCWHTCQCGIVHFDSDEGSGWDWEDGELEGFVKKERRYPELYQAHLGPVHMYLVSGQELVMGCTCSEGLEAQRFIDYNGPQIAKYMNTKAKQMADEAKSLEVRVPEEAGAAKTEEAG